MRNIVFLVFFFCASKKAQIVFNFRGGGILFRFWFINLGYEFRLVRSGDFLFFYTEKQEDEEKNGTYFGGNIFKLLKLIYLLSRLSYR